MGIYGICFVGLTKASGFVGSDLDSVFVAKKKLCYAVFFDAGNSFGEVVGMVKTAAANVSGRGGQRDNNSVLNVW